MIYLKLFFEFFKIGLFAVGGGMATYPFLEDLADKTGWFTRLQLADMLAISESTPGPIGINMATYVGFTAGGGPLGGLIATLGIITPCVIVILLIVRVLNKFKGSRLVNDLFYGLRPASAAMIAAAGASVAVQTFAVGGTLHWKGLLLAGLLLYLTRWCKPTKGLHPVVFIALSAAAGILFGFAGV